MNLGVLGVRGKFYLFLCGVLTFDRKYIWVGSGYFTRIGLGVYGLSARVD